jgi:hypothetical protein
MMELLPTWCQNCVCGRTFSLPQAYSFHKCSCQKTKKRLAGALEKAKGVWQARKRQTIEEMAVKQVQTGLSHFLDVVSEPFPNEATCYDMVLFHIYICLFLPH